jgi:uncharacterized membrane protein YbhN (UPF0104 family)
VTRRHLVAGAAGALVSGALVGLLPRLSGTRWHEVARLLAVVPPGTLLVLVLLWAAGVVGHTWVQCAALPGLGRRRALMLNAATSAVSGAVPGGGPLSLAATWAMLRSWGFSRGATTTYTVVTTAVVALGKVLVPLPAAVAVVLVTDVDLPPGPRHAVVAGVVVAAVVALVVATAAVGARGLVPLRDLVRGTRAVVRRGWVGLLAGSLAQLAAQFLLLLAALRAVGAPVGPLTVLLAFAAGRLASLLPVTPGGVGLTEAVTTAALVALGCPGTAAVSGPLLFTAVVIGAELPLGAAGLLWWRLGSLRPEAA